MMFPSFRSTRLAARSHALGVLTMLAALTSAAVAAPPAPHPAHHAPAMPAALVQAIADTGLPTSAFGIYAQEVLGERTMLAMNEEQPYMMASTTKIVTSLAALDLLGPFYRWHTSAYALGTLADGRLVGDLLIVGGGNAELSSAELAAWFARMREQGLREIDGNIVLDRFAFQLQPSDLMDTPSQADGEPRHVWPDAMTLDEGQLGVQVSAGRGGRPVIALRPALADVHIDNRLTAEPGCDITPHWEAGKGDRATVVVQGHWTAACGNRSLSFVPPPGAGIAARALPAMWAAAGGVLTGRVVSQRLQPGVSPVPLGPGGVPMQPLSFHRSKPLNELVRDMNKVSDNVAARNLMLTLSPGFPERPATLAGAQKIVGMWLRDQGLSRDDVAVETGSGLSHSERAKPRAMVQLLRKAWTGDQAQAFFQSLPVAGVDGTLKNRLQGGAASGQAFLKTGTLNDTCALAGYVHGQSGKMYAVAVMVNDADPKRGRPAMDALIEWLARHG